MKQSSHRSMAYLEVSDQKPVVQYLQSAIIQLFNDHIPYSENLQILGVLCVTVDNQVDEIVVKVNSTLKRINSLTPPKERSPDIKNNNLKSKDSSCRDFNRPGLLVASQVHGTERVSSPSCLDLIPHKSRGRKQSKPAKVKSVDYSQDEHIDEPMKDDQCCGDSSPSEEVGCFKKRKYFFQTEKDEDRCSNFELPGDRSPENLRIKTEFQNEGCYSHLGLDLSLFSKKNVKQENESCLATSSLGDDEDRVVSTSLLNSATTHHLRHPCQLPFGASESQFVALLKHSPSLPAHSTSSLYRKILPAGPGSSKHQLASNTYLSNNLVIPDSFEFKNEDDYLLDCLSSDGKKRRRRSLEDALTADEMLEYMGSRDKSEASFACRICGEASSDLLKYFHHTLSCHKAFICHQCGRCFTTKSSLLRHRPIHTGLRRFACGICHKAFYRKDKCKAHIKKHAEVQEDQDASHNLQVL